MLAFAAPAAAQSTVDRTAGLLEELVVTAQKRSENIQDVPITMLAVTGETITSQNIVDIDDLSRSIPNLSTVQLYSASAPVIFMRGLGVDVFSPAVSGAVGVSVDEVFFNSNLGQGFQLYDVERVEVLKGPQGTLQGHNVTGGMLSLYTKRPTFAFDPTVTARYGRFNERSAEAATSIPLVPERLALRLSASSRTRDGTRKDTITGNDWNDVNAFAFRGQVLAIPNEAVEIHAKYEYTRNRSSMYLNESLGIFSNPATRARCSEAQIKARGQCSNIFGYIDTADPFTGATDVPFQPENADGHGIYLGVQYSGAGVTLNSISSWTLFDRKLRLDIDASPNRIYGVSPSQDAETTQWTQELRLSSDSEGPFQWILGAYFLREHLDTYSGYEAILNPRLPLPATNLAQLTLSAERGSGQRIDSYAAFGHATYAFSDRLKATAGVRITHEKRDVYLYSVFGPAFPTLQYQFLQNPICCLVGDPASINPATGLPTRPIQDDASFSKPSWRVAVDYKTDLGIVYGSYARGVRAGSFNIEPALNGREFGYVPPERIDMFEVGFKFDLTDWARLNAAAFYYTGNVQAFTFSSTNIGARILASPEVEGYGLESELFLRPTKALAIAANLGLVHAELVDYPNRPQFNGHRMVQTPEITVGVDARYDIAISEDWTLRLQTDAAYRSKVYFTPDNTDLQSQDGYALWNARVALRREGEGLEFALWARNLTDKVYYVSMLDATPFGAYVTPVGDPRTYGVSISYRY